MKMKKKKKIKIIEPSRMTRFFSHLMHFEFTPPAAEEYVITLFRASVSRRENDEKTEKKREELRETDYLLLRPARTVYSSFHHR